MPGARCWTSSRTRHGNRPALEPRAGRRLARVDGQPARRGASPRGRRDRGDGLRHDLDRRGGRPRAVCGVGPDPFLNQPGDRRHGNRQHLGPRRDGDDERRANAGRSLAQPIRAWDRRQPCAPCQCSWTSVRAPADRDARIPRRDGECALPAGDAESAPSSAAGRPRRQDAATGPRTNRWRAPLFRAGRAHPGSPWHSW